jgi:oxygen-independent coproporphyrinogen-3 oxidase
MGIGLYIHIPFCTKKCGYCNFYSVPVQGQDVPKLCSCLITEIQRRLEDPVDTIYIGGGSPSCLGENLIDLTGRIIEITGTPEEFTVEVNPTQADRELLENLIMLGVNRISIGVQSFNPAELKVLERNVTPEQISESIKIAKKAGFDNISLDLIYAIPGQTIDSWEETLKAAIEANPTHISAYSLSFEEGTPLMNQLNEGKIRQTDENIDRLMYDTAIDKLAEAGFEQYEISNFAKSEFQCQHNLKYWNNTEYLGVGPAAGSFYKNQRTLNFADMTKYFIAIESEHNPFDEIHIPNEMELACETAVLGLRKIKGINFARFNEQTGCDFLEMFAVPVKNYTEQKLLILENDSIRLARVALPIADSILSDFSYV